MIIWSGFYCRTLVYRFNPSLSYGFSVLCGPYIYQAYDEKRLVELSFRFSLISGPVYIYSLSLSSKIRKLEF